MLKTILIVSLLTGCTIFPEVKGKSKMACKHILLDDDQNLEQVYDGEKCQYIIDGYIRIYTISNGEVIHHPETIDTDLYLLLPVIDQSINTVVFAKLNPRK